MCAILICALLGQTDMLSPTFWDLFTNPKDGGWIEDVKELREKKIEPDNHFMINKDGDDWHGYGGAEIPAVLLKNKSDEKGLLRGTIMNQKVNGKFRPNATVIGFILKVQTKAGSSVHGVRLEVPPGTTAAFSFPLGHKNESVERFKMLGIWGTKQ
jgi:hypothetical protein